MSKKDRLFIPHDECHSPDCFAAGRCIFDCRTKSRASILDRLAGIERRLDQIERASRGRGS